jgi:hypothetical protein
VDGEISLVDPTPDGDAPARRPSLRDLLLSLPQQTVSVLCARLAAYYRPGGPRTLKPGDMFDLRSQARVGVVLKQSALVQIEGDKLSAWVRRKFPSLTETV